MRATIDNYVLEICGTQWRRQPPRNGGGASEKRGTGGVAPGKCFRAKPFQNQGNALFNAGERLFKCWKRPFTKSSINIRKFPLINWPSKPTIERGCPNLRSHECIEIDKNLYKTILGSYYIEVILRHNSQDEGFPSPHFLIGFASISDTIFLKKWGGLVQPPPPPGAATDGRCFHIRWIQTILIVKKIP